MQVEQVLDNLGLGRRVKVRAEETGDGGWRYHTIVESPAGKRTCVGENIPQELMRITGRLEMADHESVPNDVN